MEDQNQIHDLIDKYLDENLQPQETEDLERLLLKSEAARKAFWELTEIHGLLRETLNNLPVDQGSEESIIKFKRTNRLLKFILTAACIATALLLVATWKAQNRPGPAQIAEDFGQSHQYLAKIGFQSREVRDSGKFQPEQFLKSGPLELSEGLMELVFFNKVTVLLQGPAGIHLKSLDHMVLSHGQFTADVPEGAEGFTVSTPQGKIIDLGTQFGVSVTEDGNVETHVFSGEIEVSHKGRKRKLREAQALRLATTGVDNLNASPKKFPSLKAILDVEVPHGSFENEAIVESEGWPGKSGIWSGDNVRLVGSEQGIQPHSGKKMLRFYQTYHDSEVVQPGNNSYMCTQQQLIDIRDLRLAHPEARLTAEIKAHFNRIDAGPTTDSQFTVGIRSITGSPSNPLYSQTSRRKSIISDNDPMTWEPVVTKISIPRDTKFILIEVEASENEFNDPHESEELHGHYADSISLKIERSPIPGRN